MIIHKKKTQILKLLDILKDISIEKISKNEIYFF